MHGTCAGEADKGEGGHAAAAGEHARPAPQGGRPRVQARHAQRPHLPQGLPRCPSALLPGAAGRLLLVPGA